MTNVKKIIFSGLYGAFIQGIARIPLTAIIGTPFASFSLATGLTPVAGFFGGNLAGLIVYFARCLTAFALTHSLFTWVHFLPTLGGSLYLSAHSQLFKASLVLSCITSFLLHPVGFSSWYYTLYWLPPLVLSIVSVRSIFMRACASTLTTHAIGSVLWLYTHETNPLFWKSLMSLVWIERLMFALLMTAAYYGTVSIMSLVKNLLARDTKRRV